MSKLALITGGTKGIGKSVANIFAENGYNLILTYSSDKQSADKCREDLKNSYYVEVATIQADSTDRHSIEFISNYVQTHNVKLDVVIFNAAITLRSSLETTVFEEWDKVFFANIHFPTFLLQQLLPYIKTEGNVIFTGSLMGIYPHGTSLAYGVTKSATHALVKNLVKVLKPYNIRVNGVAPGFVDTDWQRNKPAEIRHNIEKKIALERFCIPEEIGRVYLMLVKNHYFNGEIIKIDGGYDYQ